MKFKFLKTALASLIMFVSPMLIADTTTNHPHWDLKSELELGWWDDGYTGRERTPETMASYDVNNDGFKDIIAGTPKFPRDFPEGTDPATAEGTQIDIFFSDGNGNFTQATEAYFQGGTHSPILPREFCNCRL